MKSQTTLRQARGRIVLLLLILIGMARPALSAEAPFVSEVLQFGSRESMLASGTAVLQIKNRTTAPIPVTLNYVNQGSKQTKTYNAGTIAPGKVIEVGILESGWTVEANEEVTVSAPNYRPATLYFYKDQNGKLIYSIGWGRKKANQLMQALENLLK